MSGASEWRKLEAEIKARGFSVVHGKRHKRVLRPDGTFVCPLPTSPSDSGGALDSKRRELRQRGVL